MSSSSTAAVVRGLKVAVPTTPPHPTMGFGTYTLGGSTCDLALEAAFNCGYRLVDTASGYKNESVVGDAIKRSLDTGKFMRSDLWVTTKISPNALKCPEAALKLEIQGIMETSAGVDSTNKMEADGNNAGAATVVHGAEKREREGEEGDEGSTSTTTTNTTAAKSNSSKKRSQHGCMNPYAPANAPPLVREQAFINLCTRSVRESCTESVTTLRTGYVDVLMLHWPAIGGRPVKDPLNIVLRNHVLLEMVKLTRTSCPQNNDNVEDVSSSSLSSSRWPLARFVAVSNFQIRHLEAFRQFYATNNETQTTTTTPQQHHLPQSHPIHIHQFEFHPLCRQRSILRYCIINGISVQQYSPLGSAGAGVAQLLSLPCVATAAQELSKFLIVHNDNGGCILADLKATDDVSSSQQHQIIVTAAQMCIIWGYWYFYKEYNIHHQQQQQQLNHYEEKIGGTQVDKTADAYLLPPHSTLPRSQTPSRIIENFQASKIWDAILNGRTSDGAHQAVSDGIEAVFARLETALLDTRNDMLQEKNKAAPLLAASTEEVAEQQPAPLPIGGGDGADLGADEYDVHYCWESSKVL